MLVGCAKYLDQILALGLRDKRLQLGRGEGIHQARLRYDKKQNLRTS